MEIIAAARPKILRFVAFSLKKVNPIIADTRTTPTFVTAKTVESSHPVE